MVLVLDSEVKLSWLGPGKVGLKTVLLGKMPFSDLLLLSQADWQLCSSPPERTTFEESGSSKDRDACGIRLWTICGKAKHFTQEQRKKRKSGDRVLCAFDDIGGIQLDAEVKCRAMIIANDNKQKAEVGLPQPLRHKVQGDWSEATCRSEQPLCSYRDQHELTGQEKREMVWAVSVGMINLKGYHLPQRESSKSESEKEGRIKVVRFQSSLQFIHATVFTVLLYLESSFRNISCNCYSNEPPY